MTGMGTATPAPATATALAPPIAMGAERRSRLGMFWKRFSRNRLAVLAALFLLLIYTAAILAPAISPRDPNAQNVRTKHRPPGSEYVLGSDESGRDVLARLLFGSRISLSVGLIAVTIAISIGTVVGATAGFFRGWLDSVLMRFTDGMLSIPTFFLLLTYVSVFGSSFQNIVLVLGLTSWMVVARVVRGDVIKYRGYEFVTAARTIGATDQRILWRHILPHAVPSIVVAATLGVAGAILSESALSYLGLGIKPPEASWGNMLSNAQAYLWENPILPVYPGTLILFTVLSYNFLGDALRDALDPQVRATG